MLQKNELDKIASSIPENPNHKYMYNVKQRARLLNSFFEILGYDLSEDVARIQLDDSNALLIAATAGAGKTTNIGVKMALIKATMISPNFSGLVNGERILALVYNRHNVEQITKAQEKIIRKLSRIEGLNIDDKLRAYTMHKFCKIWIRDCKSSLDLPSNAFDPTNQPLNDKEIKNMILTIAKLLLGKDPTVEIFADPIKQFYDLIRETLIPYERMDELVSFPSLGLEKEFVIKLFNALDKMKKTKRRFDFTDTLIAFEKGLRENEDVRTMITTHYDYITVDEVQDFTPVMMEIVRHLQTPQVPIICIGDDDQSIYGFKGADLFNTLDFESKFEGGNMLSLTLNRRCSEKIINAAVKVIEHNTIRLDKDIKGNRPGGVINKISYASQEGQLLKVIDSLLSKNKEELENTIICYRKQSSSIQLGEMLLQAKVSFNIISGYKPLNHRTYSDIRDILTMLAKPGNVFTVRNLYKIMPLSKKEYYSILKIDYKTEETTADYEHGNFYDRDFGQHARKPMFLEILNKLKLISMNINELKVSEYLPLIVSLYKKYHWNFKVKNSENMDLEEFYLKRAFQYFNKDDIFTVVDSNFESLMQQAKINDYGKRGVTLSTFHGLKGLEYKHVIIIDMDDEIFPDYKRIDDNDKLTEKQALQLKEDEVRLFYVALTRARDKLDIYYSEDNPSLFISWLDEPDKVKIENKFKSDVGFSLSSAFGFTDSLNEEDSSLSLSDNEEDIDDLFDDLGLEDVNSENIKEEDFDDFIDFEDEDSNNEIEVSPMMEEIDKLAEKQDYSDEDTSVDLGLSFLNSVLDRF